MKVVRRITLSLVVTVVPGRVFIVQRMVGRTPEKGVIGLGAILTDKALELLKIGRIPIVLGNHIFGNASARHIREKPLEHVSGINTAKGIEENGAVIGTSRLEFLKVLLVTEGNLGLLAREVAKNVPELSDEAEHRICESLSEFFLIKFLRNRNRDKQGDLFCKVRTT